MGNPASIDFISWVGDTVTGGHLIAVALVCLVQYAYHTYRLSFVRKEKNGFSTQIGSLSDELTVIKKEHSLSCMENSILKEFLAQASTQQAFELLLKRYASDPEIGFAAFIESSNAGTKILQSRGLTTRSRSRFSLDDTFVKQAKAEGIIHLKDHTLLNSPLLAQLAPADRRKLSELFILHVDTNQSKSQLFVTSSLYPAEAPYNQQVRLAIRLMQSIAETFKQAQNQEHQVHQLESSKHMLRLRAVQDGQYDSPIEMLESFVFELARIVEADGGAIFLGTSRPEATVRPLVYSLPDLASHEQDNWKKYHNRLTVACTSRRDASIFDVHTLANIGINSLIQSAVVIPLIQNDSSIGSLCITSRENEPFTPTNMELIDWAADYLSDTILRVLNQAAVERWARVDGLTQLANRREFDTRLPREIQQTISDEQCCSLMLCDLDHFKSINDSYGHQAGDVVLKTIASVISTCLSEYELEKPPLTARYGGEEIAIILPNVALENALNIGNSIRVAIGERSFHFDGTSLQVTASIGVATSPNHAIAANELVAQADAALYRAKRAGRNRVVSAISIDAVTQK